MKFIRTITQEAGAGAGPPAVIPGDGQEGRPGAADLPDERLSLGLVATGLRGSISYDVWKLFLDSS